MIYCPKCGKRTNVLETRTDCGISRRRRLCEAGHQTLTEERVVKSTRTLVQLMSDRDQSEAKHA